MALSAVELERLRPVLEAWSIVRGMGVPVDVVPCTRSEFEEEKGELAISIARERAATLPRAWGFNPRRPSR